MQTIYDGIQRPLERIADVSNSVYIPRGINLPALDRTRKWRFFPSGFAPGDKVAGGCVIGHVKESDLVKKHLIMLPPRAGGTVTQVWEEDDYTVEHPLIEVEFEGKKTTYGMLQTWPVRVPRPVNEPLQAQSPLIVGQRVLDSLFPAVQGGTVCIPGAFGCGKTVISQSLSKFSNCDVIVYVGCGERGNEMAEVLKDFPTLTISRDGKEVPIMERTCLIANTSNMPVAAREASIYTGITIAEYYRDMGMNVAMMADSSSRWAEALREISGRLGEMPADQGYPAYLGSKLASFYERAGKVSLLGYFPEKEVDGKSVGGPEEDRDGSVSIVAAVSPPGGDFSDPVTSATLGIVQVFWGLDKKLAQRKHFPSINTADSYSKYLNSLEKFYQQNFKELPQFRDQIMTLLTDSSEVEQAVQLVGKSAIGDPKLVVLDVADMIKNDFLQQNGYSDYDQFCPLWKTEYMMRAMLKFYHKSAQAVSAGESAVAWAKIKEATQDVQDRLRRMKFEVPSQNDKENDEIRTRYKKLLEDIDEAFSRLV